MNEEFDPNCTPVQFGDLVRRIYQSVCDEWETDVSESLQLAFCGPTEEKGSSNLNIKWASFSIARAIVGRPGGQPAPVRTGGASAPPQVNPALCTSCRRALNMCSCSNSTPQVGAQASGGSAGGPGQASRAALPGAPAAGAGNTLSAPTGRPIDPTIDLNVLSPTPTPAPSAAGSGANDPPTSNP